MTSTGETLQMKVFDFEVYDREEGVEHVRLRTSRGDIEGRLHWTDAGDAAIVWVFGAGGGLGGPAGGLYPRLAERLRSENVTSLRLDYREAGVLQECVLDTLAGVALLSTRGKGRIVLVGHSFGGAVVITAGAYSQDVIAVAALSSQTSGAEAVTQLNKPLLLIHGEEDDVLPDACSRSLYARAREPKKLILYPNGEHGLDACRDELDRDLQRWLEDVFAGMAPTQE